MSKAAAMLVVDLNSPPAALAQCKAICARLALEKMVLAPYDELGLVTLGAAESDNGLRSVSSERFNHIVVERGVMPPNADFIEQLDAACCRAAQPGTSDFVDALLVAAHHLRERAGTRKYSRSIYLFSPVTDEVRGKEDFTTVVQVMQRDAVSLLVVGVDFAEVTVDDDTDWSGLTEKATNERVLRHLCATLGEEMAAVMTVEGAMRGVMELRPRKVAQRPLMKLALSIGEIRIAVQMYTKTQEAKLPTLQKVTSDGKLVHLDVRHVSVADVEKVVERDQLIRAFRYGRTLVPCTEADLAAMDPPSERSLQAIAFVPLHQVPPYITMGGAKSLGPLPEDEAGTRAFTCLVRAMNELQHGMIVRMVRTRSSRPSIGICVPSCNAKRDVLFYSPLPFSEDVRMFQFATYEEIRCSEEEERLVDKLVSAMTVGDDVLRPSDTFNPVIQQFYETLRWKLLHHRDGAGGTGVPPLLEQLRRTSTAFGDHHNVLRMPAEVATLQEQCATAFPYCSAWKDLRDATEDVRLRAAANASDQALGRSDRSVSVDPSVDSLARGAPPTVAPGGVAASILRTAVAGAPAGSERSTESFATAAYEAELVSPSKDAGPPRVTTVNPVASFQAVLLGWGPCAAPRAFDEMVEVVFALLRNSVKDSLYTRCSECINALRQHCVATGEPNAFNSFLVKLMLLCTTVGRETFWAEYVVGRHLGPITRTECASSELADDVAATAFLLQDRSIPVPSFDDDSEDDVLDLII